ncbi:hypothetical protein GRI40_03245 [Altererythrobacter aerius]|uniref:Uncharacterized protein n=1 Tax=Tsuneonella aeria TaxID=1837929 RepID=A0A6I4TCW9_9SPHN|nr:hypothetical protein [Tsuneonella aeria]MXO74238.1 hypothetical protein [Tsuneonella aeria]
MTGSPSLAVRETARAFGEGRQLAKAKHNAFLVEAVTLGADLWIRLSRDAKSGGLAWRVPLLTEGARIERVEGDDLLAFTAVTDLGTHRITVSADESDPALFSLEHAFRPDRALHLPFIPRDLIAVGPGVRAERPKGTIEASQRRLNTGLCYFSLDEPDFGKVLYLQDLTRLNAYFNATGTKPENAVGGEWPELGYLAPTHPDDPSAALPGGRETVLSSAHILVRRFPQEEEIASAWQFLDMLAALYRRIDRPEAMYRDWVGRSRRTLDDLRASPKARTRHRGNTYFHPYTATEYPDSMVQLSLLSAIHEWGRWQGKRDPLEREIVKGLRGFYDPKLKALRRYLPDVGDDKDADAVDSWYMYHPMAMLCSLALDGEEEARALLLDTVDYGIKAAQHFEYRWPIQYKVDTFEVITAVAADDRGQTDVNGMYAWVMLQVHALTGEARFLAEARAAIEAAAGSRFHLNYQANLTAWGAAACILLWRITNQKHYLSQSYVYLASFFHNSLMWKSEIGAAREYGNFMGVTCLQDAPYMAMYECFDSFAAFETYLDLGGPDLIPSVKLLVSEYCRYALHRAWFYYPDALPEDAMAKDDIRNGHIDRALSFPLEDLYPDGQPAGQVGQEIYGAGGAMVFATRAFHRVERAPFMLHCDHFVRALTRMDECAISFAIDGPAAMDAAIALIADKPRRSATTIVLRGADGQKIPPLKDTGTALCRFSVPTQGAYTLSW